MSYDFDYRARQAAARLRAAVGDTKPRKRTTMPLARTRFVAAVTVGAVLAVVGVAVVLTRSSSTTTSTNLLPTAGTPMASATTVFAPAGLGASITVPSSWKPAPPTSGFQYVIQGSGEFVLAARESGFVPLSPTSLAKTRTTFLRSRGGNILSQTTGTVDGRPAAKLHYRLSDGTVTVDDTEYDIITTSTMPVGASQNQREYNDIIIVLGSPPAAKQEPTLQWIASTLRIAS